MRPLDAIGLIQQDFRNMPIWGEPDEAISRKEDAVEEAIYAINPKREQILIQSWVDVNSSGENPIETQSSMC